VHRRGTQMRITDVIEHAASSSQSLLANQAVLSRTRQGYELSSGLRLCQGGSIGFLSGRLPTWILGQLLEEC
jgi:hypothetical protein